MFYSPPNVEEDIHSSQFDDIFEHTPSSCQSTDVVDNISKKPDGLAVHNDSTTSSPSPSIGSPTPSSCYSGGTRTIKKSKAKPVEDAFCRLNTTLGTIVSHVTARASPNDPDIIIGQLVTAELKKLEEPKKSQVKQKIFELLYSN